MGAADARSDSLANPVRQADFSFRVRPSQPGITNPASGTDERTEGVTSDANRQPLAPTQAPAGPRQPTPTTAIEPTYDRSQVVAVARSGAAGRDVLTEPPPVPIDWPITNEPAPEPSLTAAAEVAATEFLSLADEFALRLSEEADLRGVDR